MALFFRVKDEDEAIALANDSDYGLGGSVFTQDIERGKRVASRIETGDGLHQSSNLDRCGPAIWRHQKLCYGRELSSHGIHEFVNKKLVRVAAIDAPA